MRNQTSVKIVGYSALTPLGIESPRESQFWENLISGNSYFYPIEHFDPIRAADHRVGLIKDESLGLHPFSHPNRLLDLMQEALLRAFQSSGLRVEELNARRGALILGTTDIGGWAAHLSYEVFRKKENSLAVSEARRSLNAFYAIELCRRMGLNAEPFTLGNASAASAVALGFGRDLILSGDFDFAICVGGDGITESAFQGLFSLRTLAPEGCRPFHPERRGIRISEGAGVMILAREGSSHSEIATLAGYGASHISSNPARPDPEGIAHALEVALSQAGLNPDQIGYINLHGAGTVHGDRAEVEGLKKIFGTSLKIPLSSTKPSMGHCQGAAGILEALVVLRSLQEQCLPQTQGLENIDPEFQDLDLVSRPRSVQNYDHGISISCGLGGTNTAVVLSRFR